MNNNELTFCATVTVVLFLALTSIAQAQMSRTFVSADGKDSNPCDSPEKPCRNIQAGITKVLAGGEVVVISSGSYQPFTVNKSVTVVGSPGAHVAISAAVGVDGVKVQAAPADVIVLRGLTIKGAGANVSDLSEGIEFAHNQGKSLHVENCVISGFENGLFFNADGNLYIKDTSIKNNWSAEILVGTSPGKPIGVIERTRFESSTTGIHLIDDARLTIRDSVFLGPGQGIVTNDAGPTSGTAEINIENTIFTGNVFGGIVTQNNAVVSVSNCTIAHGNVGIFSNSPGSVIRVSSTTITRNVEGLKAVTGSILSRGNNTLEGNTTDGAFTGSFAAK